MNRIKLRPLAQLSRSRTSTKTQTSPLSEVPLFDEQDFQPKSYAHTIGNPLLDYSLFIPKHYESNYAYPLIVWLHSSNSDHRQIFKLMPKLSSRNFAAVAVAADSSEGWSDDPLSVESTMAKLHVAMDHARLRLNINSQRVFIAGEDMGGSLALRIAFSEPDCFAGAASINGAFRSTHRPLANWNRCRDLPLFIAHARDSQNFPEHTLCEQLRLLHTSGFSLTLRQYPCDDCFHPQVYPDLNSWIMEMIGELSSSDSIIE